ncbi:phospholipase D family protein [Pseudomonas sp. ZM23]|uniref:Phospholipase D family protein n=1 Tax=Pseudomonas triclosanedens TaxID=2961893 RepID=A0ABY6ZWX5_9PSED|nr:phospholipase D family protein [Pseudomonas triclosanedens]MCP8466930.1 phospholipase D family protein [Pseudomonas triclosanedens]MCP8470154.1 phospholipase D family protein [Pseudomonas triclosanedens]MCP8478064.1 phospholipase D family protein [Pseudomonas triclosanedens]WAI49474.1 phospholipase D family protein [Pseudomonas triclosanedens]
MLSRLLLLALLVLGGCASTPSPTPSHILPVQGTALDSEVRQRGAAHPGLSGFHLLASSVDAFLARAELIRRAQRSLDIQYYIVHDGLTTRALIRELLHAADRGVRIRLLIDDTSSDGWDYELGALAAHPNIQVRLFNPLHLGRSTGLTRNMGRLFNLSEQHRRMHNKLWLADNSVAIVGGRNLGDEYFDAKAEMNFSDLDLLSVGPVAQSLGQSFDEYWNSAISRPIEDYLWGQQGEDDLASVRRSLDRYMDRERVRRSGYIARLNRNSDRPHLDNWFDDLVWAPGRAIWDAPLKVLDQGNPKPEQMLSTQLAPLFDNVSQELILVSAYFVPTSAGVDYLTRRADQGVSVRLLTNSLEATDVPAVHAGYAPYRMALLEHGVKLFELRAEPDARIAGAPWMVRGSSSASLHSKAAVFDRQQVFVGSLNFDPRSVLWNTEVGVIVDSPELAEQVRRLALAGMSPSVSYQVKIDRNGAQPRLIWVDERDGQRHTRHHEPGSLWRRFNAWIAGAIGLEKML